MTGEAVIGIDLGGTNCRAALATVEGEISGSQRISTEIHLGLEHFLDRLIGLCLEVQEKGEKKGVRISAIGMGAPGVIAPDGTVTSSPNLAILDGFPLADELRKRLHLPVTLLNDANAIAWGEALFGAGREFSSFLMVTLGTGVGGGLVLGRNLWFGADGAAGEVGHIMVEPEGRTCGCGSRGCLEQYASATGIVRSVREAFERGEPSLAREMADEDMTSQKIALFARREDPVCREAFQEAGRRLGQALGGIVNLLNPDGIVFGGGASEALDLIRPSLEKELEYRAFEVPVRRLKIVRGVLGDNAGILGAVRLAWDRLEIL